MLQWFGGGHSGVDRGQRGAVSTHTISISSGTLAGGWTEVVDGWISRSRA